MNSTRTGLLLPLVLAGCAHASAPADTTARIQVAANVISVPTLTRHIEVLASDEFGGRAPGTEGEKRTVDYLIGEFTKAGLSPGNGDSYTQTVPLSTSTVVNDPVFVVSGGTGDDLQLRYRDEHVIWSRQQAGGAAIENSMLVFVGYGINAPERNWNDYAGVDVRGKTVVMLINDPGYATQDPDLFNGNAMTYYGRWDYKLDEAARQGARGAIIIHDTKPAAYPWTTVAASWTGAQFDLVREDKGAELCAIEGWIGKQYAQRIFAKAGLDLGQLTGAAARPGFKAVAMNLRASAEVENRLSRIDSQNVVAKVEGSESPDEIFIYMAHWDHIGIKKAPSGGDGIYNGALDNASGTAGLLELARAFAALPEKPKRSVMFMATTAEEQGLLGSAYYAAHPIYPLDKTFAGLNMDGLSNLGRSRDIVLIGRGLSDLDAYLIAQAKKQDRIVIADPMPEKGSFFRSDHFELVRTGVPMLYPKPGLHHRENGPEYGRRKVMEYVAKHYHRPSDEYDESWDLNGAVEDLRLYFLTGLSIINSGDWPKWSPDSEFKAARDAQHPSVVRTP